MAFKLVSLEKCLLEVSSCRVMLVMMATIHAIHLLLELIEVRIVLVACPSTEHEAPILASLLLMRPTSTAKQETCVLMARLRDVAYFLAVSVENETTSVITLRMRLLLLMLQCAAIFAMVRHLGQTASLV